MERRRVWIVHQRRIPILQKHAQLSSAARLLAASAPRCYFAASVRSGHKERRTLRSDAHRAPTSAPDLNDSAQLCRRRTKKNSRRLGFKAPTGLLRSRKVAAAFRSKASDL